MGCIVPLTYSIEESSTPVVGSASYAGYDVETYFETTALPTLSTTGSIGTYFEPVYISEVLYAESSATSIAFDGAFGLPMLHGNVDSPLYSEDDVVLQVSYGNNTVTIEYVNDTSYSDMWQRNWFLGYLKPAYRPTQIVSTETSSYKLIVAKSGLIMLEMLLSTVSNIDAVLQY
jgi:hypothetical protein